MEEQSKKGYKRFKFIFSIFLILFAVLYIANKTGYYEKSISKNTLLTSEALRQFEKDTKEGKAVDITNYISKNKKDYRNTYSDIGYTISSGIDSLLNDGTVWIVDLLKALFT